MDLPLIMSSTGPLITDTTVIRSQLDAAISAEQPGYTSTLPGTLIEDILSTDCGAVVACDQARVEAVNSLTPYGVNEYLLNQIASTRGLGPQQDEDTMQVAIQFRCSKVGYIVPSGLVVSDGTYSYTTQVEVIIGSDGLGTTLGTAIATENGSWDIPANTVTTISSTIDSDISLTATNPAAGSTYGAESATDYRSRIIIAQNIGVQGSPNFIQASVANVEGVIGRTVRVYPYSTGYIVSAAGGNQYDVALAIYKAVGDVTLLRGSQLIVSAVVAGSPTKITCSTKTGLTNGQSVTIAGATGITAINGTFVASTVDDYSFTIPVDTTGASTYEGGGYLSDSTRTQNISIIDSPNTYVIPYLSPLSQLATVTAIFTVSTDAEVSQSMLSTLVTPIILSYINSIQTGHPINLILLKYLIVDGIKETVNPIYIEELTFTVLLDGAAISPTAGTEIIPTDTTSYVYATTSTITVELL